MVAFDRFITVGETQSVVISGLPIAPGTRVRVTVLVDEQNRAAVADELRAMFKATQALPASRAVTEAEIAAELAAYRRSDAA